VAKLERLRAVGLPAELFRDLPHKVLSLYRQRLMVEEPFELRRHPQPLRLTLLAVFCVLRSQELTDTLVDVLLQLVHRISSKAERRAEHELLDDFKRVSGKQGVLFRLADASLAQPDGLRCAKSCIRLRPKRPSTTWSKSGGRRDQPIVAISMGDSQFPIVSTIDGWCRAC
jgi:hypothetical protein